METVIGLLIVVLPIVFKLIGKKLEQAAQNSAPQVQPVEDWTETLRRHLEAQISAPASEDVPVQEPVLRESAAPDVKSHAVAKAVKVTKTVKPVLREEPKKEKEKIDVKKMIIYSEIMKPKY